MFSNIPGVMKKFLLLFPLFGISVLLTFSQVPQVPEAGDEDPIISRLDSFLNDYEFDRPSNSIYDTLLYNMGRFRADEVPTYPPQVIAQRLETITSAIPLDYNVYVQRFIDVYTVKRREQVGRMLGLQKVYFPIFEAALDRSGLPMELKYLPIVESALNPHARSRVGATGLWQFMYHTGREYGLQIDSYVDERKDPHKSTEAAIRYLQDAYNEFGDWLLAIAAYNCGAGNVRKAFYRSGGKRSFWEIREYLPRETRGYVPAFVAAMYTFHYAAAHNIYPVYSDFEWERDTLHIRNMDITLEEIATRTDIELGELEMLNPHLKLNKVPYSDDPFVLRVPEKVAAYFAMNESALKEEFGTKRTHYPTLAYNSTRRTVPVTRQYTPPPVQRPEGSVVVYYTVRSGDVVGSIAEKYEVSARDIARWNNLRRYQIKVGQKLVIYTDKTLAEQKARKLEAGTLASQAQPGVSAPSRVRFYQVKKGDTLWGIAQQHTSGNVERLLALNGHLTSTTKLSIGQRIRVQ